MIMISNGFPVPLYYKIKEEVINKIKNGEYKADDKIPSENDLKKIYNVSSITVRKAFSDLVNEGYLYRIQGKGTFVAKSKYNRVLTTLSFTDELRQKGYKSDIRVLEIRTMQDEMIARLIGADNDENIVKICRLRLANDEPMALQTSYIPERFITEEECKQLEVVKSLYSILHAKGIIPCNATESYSIAKLSDKQVCELLKVPKNSSAFFVKRLTYTADNAVFEYTESYLRGDRYTIEINVRNDKGGDMHE